MYILAIETTGPFGSAAVIDEKGRALGFEVSKDTMSHLKDLIPMIDRGIKAAGIGKGEVSVIAASTGPGSFTGIRIGVSTARALAQALGIKAVSVPTLDSFLFKEELREAAALDEPSAHGEPSGSEEPDAHGEPSESKEADAHGEPSGSEEPAEHGEPSESKEAAALDKPSASKKVACPIINARRGQVYGMVDGYLKAGPYMLTDVLNIIESRVLPEGKDVIFLGDGIDAYEDIINDTLKEYDGRFCFAEKAYRYQDALSVGRWALDRINRDCQKLGHTSIECANLQCTNGEVGLPECLVDYEDLLPEYMRMAEAEQKLAAGELPICKGPKQE